MTKYVYALLYNWGQKEYIEFERRLLNKKELEKVYGKLFDEMKFEDI